MIEVQFAGVNGATTDKVFLIRPDVKMRVEVNVARDAALAFFVADALLNDKMTVADVKDVYPEIYAEFLTAFGIQEEQVEQVANVMYISGVCAVHNQWVQLDAQVLENKEIQVSAAETPAANT